MAARLIVRRSQAAAWRVTLLAAMLLIAGFSANAQQAVSGSHSAAAALRWSIIPGGGQIYNHQAWKVPIIYGAFAGMGYLVYDNYQSMKMFKDEYLYRVNHSGATSLEGYEAYPTDNIYSLYNEYNKNFQLMIIITVGIYALNLIDAYVFGHLYGFQIDDNLSLALQPSAVLIPDGLRPTLGIELHF